MSSEQAKSSVSRRARRFFPWAALAVGCVLWWRLADVSVAQRAPQAGAGGQGPQPVTAARVRAEALPVWNTALGTVTPRQLVNVMPRVSGLLQSVDYRQGQLVRAGQLLAQIDPRPFRIAVAQAQAQHDQTAAQLDGARLDLQRFETLLKQDAISAQQVADQRSTVAQLGATLQANQAALDNARLQLEWTRITAPVAGLAGLRPVDAGNMVTTSGAVGAGGTSNTSSGTGGATPIVVLAQVQPIDVTFALPQQQIGAVLARLAAGRRLTVQAWDSGNTRLLASGRLLAADNQISNATGTLNLRAEFDNPKLQLYPNQFVNVRLLVDTIADALVVPSTAVAVGAPGSYVYVVGDGGRVSLRKVTTGVSLGGDVQVTAGLKAGEQVVTDGLDRLRDGAQVRVVVPRAPGAAPAAATSGARRHRGAGAQ